MGNCVVYHCHDRDKPVETPLYPSVFQKSCSQGILVCLFSVAVFRLAHFILYCLGERGFKILLPNRGILEHGSEPTDQFMRRFPLNSLEIGSSWMWTNTIFSCKNLDQNRKEANMLQEMTEMLSHITWSLILKRPKGQTPGPTINTARLVIVLHSGE